VARKITVPQLGSFQDDLQNDQRNEHVRIDQERDGLDTKRQMQIC
jgi:hypothetical protein